MLMGTLLLIGGDDNYCIHKMHLFLFWKAETQVELLSTYNSPYACHIHLTGLKVQNEGLSPSFPPQ